MDGHQAIPAVLDINGLPVQIGLTPGETHDNQLCSVLLSELRPQTMSQGSTRYACLAGSCVAIRLFLVPNGAVSLVHVSDAPLRFDHADALIAAAIRGCGLVHLEDYMLARHFEAGRLVEMLQPFTAHGGNGAPRTIEFCLTPKTLEHYLLAA
jgi:hypothetical protein